MGRWAAEQRTDSPPEARSVAGSFGGELSLSVVIHSGVRVKGEEYVVHMLGGVRLTMDKWTDIGEDFFSHNTFLKNAMVNLNDILYRISRLVFLPHRVAPK